MFPCLVNGQKMRATPLWGFSRLSDKEKGIDETVVLLLPTDDDYIAMTEAQDDKHNNDISEVEGTIVEGEGPWTFRFVRELFKKSIPDNCPRYRLMVSSADGPQYFLVGNPVVITPMMYGRGTRCYVAYDKANNRFVFLKDAWRPQHENVETEGQLLRQLQAANVRNVPTIVCDGELDQETETPLYVPSQGGVSAAASNSPAVDEDTNPTSDDEMDCEHQDEEPEAEGEFSQTSRNASRRSSPVDDPPSPDNTSTLDEQEDSARANVESLPSQGPTPGAFYDRGQNLVRTFRHYRLVVEEVCKELTEFRSGKQLISIIRDCVRAHADAANKADILHCDVSGGNILICPTVVLDPTDGKRRVVWRGMLTDWELSKPLAGKDEDESACLHVRPGTWQFTSAWILDNPEDAVRIADDLEAFFHVSLYMGLRYLRHNCNNLQMTMFDYFDSYKYDDEEHRYLCGIDKYFSMVMGRLMDVHKKPYSFLDDDGKPGNHPIDEIFAVMLEWFRERYDALTRIPASGKKLRVDDHIALLQLLDSKLDDPPSDDGKATVWPERDKVGDQLKPAKKHRSDGADEKPRAKRVKTNESGKGSARASGSGLKVSGSSSAAIARAAQAQRTRGNHMKQGPGSSAQSKLTR